MTTKDLAKIPDLARDSKILLMFQFLLPLLLLAGFCLWHANKRNADQKWYWIILILPYLGCFIYLYDSFYGKRTDETIAEGIKQVASTNSTSNYKVEKLERDVKFSSNVKNMMMLAEAYIEVGRHKEAIALYEECRVGYLADDMALGRKLLHAFYLDRQYERCVELGKELSGDKSFNNCDQRVSYALALHGVGQSDQCYKHFADMDKQHSNYDQRYAFCQFLVDTNKVDEAKQKAATLTGEFNVMKRHERKAWEIVIDRVKNLQQEIERRSRMSGPPAATPA